MRAHIDFRGRWAGSPPFVKLEMPLSDFREHVEWLELLAPADGCTRDWRAELDRLEPPEGKRRPCREFF